MEIELSLAQNIVDSLKEIINYEINFITIDGRIMASTDPSRVGMYHKGGQKRAGQQPEGARFIEVQEGFNTAVYFNKRIVGIIGITGPTNEVIKYAKIIRKLTELMVSEAHLVNLDYSNRQHQRNIVEMITSEQFDEVNSNFSLVDFDLALNRRCVYAAFVPVNSDDIDLYSILKNHFPGKQNLIVVQETFLVMFIENREREWLEDQLHVIQETLMQNYRMALYFGIGEVCDDRESSRQSFLQAKYAYRWAKKKQHMFVQFYEQLTLELLFADGENKQIQTFSNRVLGKLTVKEKEMFHEILKVYERNNGSLTKSAEDLFIHKNTLQYRLNKLYDLTGYNPRMLSDFVTLKLAFFSEEVYQA